MRCLTSISALMCICLLHSSNGQACNASNEDLVFVVGTRAGPDVWRAMIDFVGAVVDGFSNIGQQRVRVSLIAFSDRPTAAFYLHQFDTKTAVLDALRQADYRGNSSRSLNLAAAIDSARKDGFYPARVRPSAVKVTVIVTDELPGPADTPPLQRAVRDAHTAGINLVAVGVGVNELPLLHWIGAVSGTRRTRTTFVADSCQLDGIVAATTEFVCFDDQKSSTGEVEMNAEGDYPSYLDPGVYPDASFDETTQADVRSSHTDSAIAVVVVCVLIALMITFAAIVYCRRNARGGGGIDPEKHQRHPSFVLSTNAVQKNGSSEPPCPFVKVVNVHAAPGVEKPPVVAVEPEKKSFLKATSTARPVVASNRLRSPVRQHNDARKMTVVADVNRKCGCD